MGEKSRSNHALTGSMTQENYDRMFRKKKKTKYKRANSRLKKRIRQLNTCSEEG